MFDPKKYKVTLDQIFTTTDFYTMVYLKTMGFSPIYIDNTNPKRSIVYYKITEDFSKACNNWKTASTPFNKFVDNIFVMKKDIENFQAV